MRTYPSVLEKDEDVRMFPFEHEEALPCMDLSVAYVDGNVTVWKDSEGNWMAGGSAPRELVQQF